MAEQEEAPAEEQPAEEEQAAEEEPKEEYEAPKEEEAAAEEQPAEEPAAEEPKEEEPKEEAPKEEPKKEEPKVEEEKKEDKPKKKKKKKKKSSKAAPGDCQADELWKKISAKKGAEINWYILKLKSKKNEDMELVTSGNGGAVEVVEFLSDKTKNIFFGLLKCVTTDDAMSVRSKFIYIRFVGSAVKSVAKAKLTTSMGKIDDKFPCKHLTMDLNEKCADDMKPIKMAKELLRVGGAHKPDKISFGPDQDVDVKSL